MSPSMSMESKSGMVIAVAAVLTSASTIVFSLRLFTRSYLLKTTGPDDWIMLVAQVLAITAGIATILEARAGLGRHIQTLSPESIRQSLVSFYLAIFAYNIGLNMVKMSFLLQYRRIFPSPMLRRLCLWMLGFVGAWTVLQQILLSISCVPLASLEPATASWCLDTLPIWEFTSIVSLITDFTIFIIPLRPIWQLPIPMRQKSILFGIFSLGFFVCVISIIRVPTLRAAASAQDPTWDNIGAALWSLAEDNAAIICSSLPTLRPLFFKVSSHLTSGKKSIPTGGDRVENLAHKMQDLRSSNTTAKPLQLGTSDSSDNLVTSTFDEMMYRPQSIRSIADDVRKFELGARPPTALSDAGSFVKSSVVKLESSESPK